MTFESVHFITGRVSGISMTDDLFGGKLEVTVTGPECPGGPFEHRIRVLNSRMAEGILCSDIEISDTVQAEVEELWFSPGNEGGQGHFVSYLSAGGFLEKIGARVPHTLHFIRGAYAGTAFNPCRGTEILVREGCRKSAAVTDYVFFVKGRQAKDFQGEKLWRGEEILVRTTLARPVLRDWDGRWEITGTGFEFFRVGPKPERQHLAFAPRRARVPADAAAGGAADGDGPEPADSSRIMDSPDPFGAPESAYTALPGGPPPQAACVAREAPAEFIPERGPAVPETFATFPDFPRPPAARLSWEAEDPWEPSAPAKFDAGAVPFDPEAIPELLGHGAPWEAGVPEVPEVRGTPARSGGGVRFEPEAFPDFKETSVLREAGMPEGQETPGHTGFPCDPERAEFPGDPEQAEFPGDPERAADSGTPAEFAEATESPGLSENAEPAWNEIFADLLEPYKLWQASECEDPMCPEDLEILGKIRGKKLSGEPRELQAPSGPGVTAGSGGPAKSACGAEVMESGRQASGQGGPDPEPSWPSW